MRRKAIRIFLVIAFSFAITVSSAYICYYTVAAADFFSPHLNFETFDQEFLFSAYENELKIFESSSFFNGFQLATYLFGQSSYFFSKIPYLDQETIVLRCLENLVTVDFLISSTLVQIRFLKNHILDSRNIVCKVYRGKGFHKNSKGGGQLLKQKVHSS